MKECVFLLRSFLMTERICFCLKIHQYQRFIYKFLSIGISLMSLPMDQNWENQKMR